MPNVPHHDNTCVVHILTQSGICGGEISPDAASESRDESTIASSYIAVRVAAGGLVAIFGSGMLQTSVTKAASKLHALSSYNWPAVQQLIVGCFDVDVPARKRPIVVRSNANGVRL